MIKMKIEVIHKTDCHYRLDFAMIPNRTAKCGHVYDFSIVKTQWKFVTCGNCLIYKPIKKKNE